MIRYIRPLGPVPCNESPWGKPLCIKPMGNEFDLLFHRGGRQKNILWNWPGAIQAEAITGDPKTCQKKLLSPWKQLLKYRENQYRPCIARFPFWNFPMRSSGWFLRYVKFKGPIGVGPSHLKAVLNFKFWVLSWKNWPFDNMENGQFLGLKCCSLG